MSFRRFVLIVALAMLVPLSAPSARSAPAGYGTKMPNLVSLGAGWFDFNKNTPQKEAIDFRLEYRWGDSLLPMANNYFTSWDKYFQIHPFAGVETTSRAQLYGFGGFVFDFLLGRNIVISPNVAAGLYYRGEGKRLGSFVEFRSAVEAGWRFDNEMRLTGFISHISNAGLTDLNPGANTVGAYFHIPTSVLFGR